MIASVAADQSIATQNWFPTPWRRTDSISSRNDFSGFSDRSNDLNNNVVIDVEEWSLSTIGLYREFVLSILRQAESSVISATAIGAEYQQTAKAPHITMSEAQRQAAIQLIDQWLADDSGYDERVWPILKETIEENRLSYRKRFDE